MAKEDPAGTAVRVDRLRKTYRGRRGGNLEEVVAIDDVDLVVREGELVVLLGPSGCGKTTLLRSIAGLEQPDSGEIAINGRTVFSSGRKLYLPPEQRRIGMMFQSYALWPHMTVFQNVAYPLASDRSLDRDALRAKVADVLARLGVAGLDHRFPGELSGGQQQRVALARALVGSPAVLLFDEPLSNVDAKVRRRLRAELRELKQQSRFAGVYVTHDQEEAMELADTLAVLENGKIRQIGSSADIYTRPASVYVAGFVGELNRWPASLASAGDGAGIVASPFGELAVSGLGADARAGARGWLAIRPEHVEFAPAGTGRGVRGTVRDAIYLGSRCEIVIDAAGTAVTASFANDAAHRQLPTPGQQLDVHLPQACLRWLPQ